MARPLDILDERERLAGPFAGSLLFHAAIVGLFFIGWVWLNRPKETFGDPNPAGGPAYTVASVSKIPIPHNEAPPNPVAADTRSNLPAMPAKETVQKTVPVPDKNAFEIADKKKREAPKQTHQQQYRQPAPQNQIYSRNQTALSSPMYSAQSGSGQVGIGPNSPLGSRLGWYAEIVRSRIEQQWVTNGLDARSQRQPAMVSFVILRDGAIRDVRVIQSSGNPNIDNTAARAVYQVTQLPPLPAQISDSSITAQFTFDLR